MKKNSSTNASTDKVAVFACYVYACFAIFFIKPIVKYIGIDIASNVTKEAYVLFTISRVIIFCVLLFKMCATLSSQQELVSCRADRKTRRLELRE